MPQILQKTPAILTKIKEYTLYVFSSVAHLNASMSLSNNQTVHDVHEMMEVHHVLLRLYLCISVTWCSWKFHLVLMEVLACIDGIFNFALALLHCILTQVRQHNLSWWRQVMMCWRTLLDLFRCTVTKLWMQEAFTHMHVLMEDLRGCTLWHVHISIQFQVNPVHNLVQGSPPNKPQTLSRHTLSLANSSRSS